MIRKLVLALGATAALAAAALTPTTASAWSHNHGGWGHHYRGYGYYGPTYIASPDCYVVKKVVYTDFGPRVRRVTVCD